MKAMILAAGLGTRLRPFSNLRPKPLFPVLDQPLLKLILAQLRHSQFGPIVINAHHLHEQIANLVNGEPDTILQEESEILGTGGGLRLASLHFGNDPVLVTNGDIYHTVDYNWVYQQHLLSGASVTLVLHDYPRFNNVAVTEDNRVVGFGDSNYSKEGARLLAFTGIHVIDPAILTMIPTGTFYNIIDCYRSIILEGGLIGALVIDGHYWTDIGTPADYLTLHAHLLKGDIRLNSSLPVEQPESFYYGKDISLGDDVSLEDWVCLGSGCRVESGVKLSRVVVWDGAHVKAGVQTSDAVLV